MLNPWPTPDEMADFRAEAEAGMLDTCKVERVTTTFDPATGKDTEVSALRYQGPCRVQDPAYVDREAAAGGYEWTIDTTVLQLPVTGSGYQVDPDTGRQFVIAKGDRATLTTLGPMTDPDLLGAVLTVKGQGRRKSNPVRRDLICEAVS